MNTTTALYNLSTHPFTGTKIEKRSGRISLIKEALQLQKVLAYMIRHKVATRLKAGLSIQQNIQGRIYRQRHEKRQSLNFLIPLPCRK